MDLNCDISYGASYISASQRARVISESWLTRCGYCLACDSERLTPTPRNTQARDFQCEKCQHPYELKSTRGTFGKQINDGAYASMMKRIKSACTPSFLLLEHTADWNVSNLFAIHHSVITPAAIKARKPLAATAKRSGWIGCNILLGEIPKEGRIYLIQDGTMQSKSQSRAQFSQNEKLSRLSFAQRTWTVAVLNLISSLERPIFTLADVYTFEPTLQSRYPSNRHIREKLRQQLQVLRDLGYLKFISRGVYELTHARQ